MVWFRICWVRSIVFCSSDIVICCVLSDCVRVRFSSFNFFRVSSFSSSVFSRQLSSISRELFLWFMRCWVWSIVFCSSVIVVCFVLSDWVRVRFSCFKFLRVSSFSAIVFSRRARSISRELFLDIDGSSDLFNSCSFDSRVLIFVRRFSVRLLNWTTFSSELWSFFVVSPRAFCLVLTRWA